MIRDMLTSIIGNPIDFVRRAVFKLIIGPFRYGDKGDYDAAGYWCDRFAKYGCSLKGAGDESLSEDENKRKYAEAAELFLDLCRRNGIDLRKMRVLEIGCGTGFYTELLSKSGVRDYTGVDITDIFFPKLRELFPEYNFIRKDVTAEEIKGSYDLVVMIDVLEHIVSEEKLDFAMKNIDNVMSTEGVFIIAPIMKNSRRRFFYLRSWSFEDVRKRFPAYVLLERVPFRTGEILILKKQEQ